MFVVGKKYLLDENQIVTCTEVSPEVACFEDDSGDLEFVLLKDHGVWRHESSGDKLVIRPMRTTDERLMEAYDHLVEAANLLFGEEGEARSAIELNLAEDILIIEEKIEGSWPHLFPEKEEEED